MTILRELKTQTKFLNAVQEKHNNFLYDVESNVRNPPKFVWRKLTHRNLEVSILCSKGHHRIFSYI
jgi:hypothetical protein